MPWLWQMFPRGAVYKVNKMGLSTLTWGMSCLSRAGSDNYPSIITLCWCSVRYDTIHFNITALIPYLCCNLCSKILWLTMSKVADESSRTRQVTLASSKFCRMSLLTLSSAVSVLWCFCTLTALSHSGCCYQCDLSVAQQCISLWFLKWKISLKLACNSYPIMPCPISMEWSYMSHL